MITAKAKLLDTWLSIVPGVLCSRCEKRITKEDFYHHQAVIGQNDEHIHFKCLTGWEKHVVENDLRKWPKEKRP